MLHLTRADGTLATDIFGNRVADQTTDGAGHYLFANLPPAEYTVSVVRIPTGYAPTTPHVGSPDLDSSTAAATSSPATGTAAIAGGADLTLDFGFVPLVSLGNLVWHDGNNNGLVDAGEQGIPNVTLLLFHEGDNPLTATPVATDVTDNNGNYLFENLLPGSYFVYIPPPPPAYPMSSTPTDTADNGEDNDDNGIQQAPGQPVRSPIIELTPVGEPDGNVDPTIDFSFIELQNLGNLVWQDMNNNGQVDAGEPGIPNVTVQLFREGDDPTTATPLQTVVTDAEGHYLFENLEPGRYFVYIPTPPLLFPISAYATDPADNGEDNDDNGDQPNSGAIRSPAVTLTPGGEPVNDGDGANGDLTVDFGFFALASLGDRVWYDVNQNGIQEPQETGVAGVLVTLYSAVTNSIVATTTTDMTGNYLFENLPPGDYVVQFTLPAGYQLSPANQGNRDAYDSDADPATLRTPTINLASGEHDPTWDMGIYLLTPPVSIGDTVWLDANKDGLQNPGETGVPGVAVTLLRGDGSIVATVETNVAGRYLFDNLPPGEYYLVFTPPAGYIITTQNVAGDDLVDSDADPITGRTEVTTLTVEQGKGEHDPSWDLGLYLPTQPAAIGDTVWFDGNANGVQDDGETGLPGVQVTLYMANGQEVATTVTNGDGHYEFINLVPGEYYLVFEPPFGYVGTLPDQGGNDALDSDANPDNGRTPATTLESGEHDPTWDYGIYLVDGETTALIPPAVIGDYVWNDTNGNGVQEGSETGVPGVTVYLYNDQGVLLATDVTDDQGHYLFPNLPPGIYIIEFVPPSGYVVTKPDQGANDGVDSDVSVDTGVSAPVELRPGDVDLTIDVGIVQRPTAVSLVNFVAFRQGENILLRWVTVAERNTSGFYVYMGAGNNFVDATRLNAHLIASQGEQGGVYELLVPYNPVYDPPLEQLTFWLVELETGGVENRYGPIQISLESNVFLPIMARKYFKNIPSPFDVTCGVHVCIAP